jgi:hypothetical protein
MAYTVSVLEPFLLYMTLLRVIFQVEAGESHSALRNQFFSVAVLQPNRPFGFGLNAKG